MFFKFNFFYVLRQQVVAVSFIAASILSAFLWREEMYIMFLTSFHLILNKTEIFKIKIFNFLFTVDMKRCKRSLITLNAKLYSMFVHGLLVFGWLCSNTRWIREFMFCYPCQK